jgi:hypothetical protein
VANYAGQLVAIEFDALLAQVDLRSTSFQRLARLEAELQVQLGVRSVFAAISSK